MTVVLILVYVYTGTAFISKLTFRSVLLSRYCCAVDKLVSATAVRCVLCKTVACLQHHVESS